MSGESLGSEVSARSSDDLTSCNHGETLEGWEPVVGEGAAAGRGGPRCGGGVGGAAWGGGGGGRLAERAPGWRARSLVVSAGACGALAPDLAVGALIVPEAVIGPDRARLATSVIPSLTRAGTLLTVADVIHTPEAKARLWIETGAIAVDMESSVLLEWAPA